MFLKIFHNQCLDISTWDPRTFMLECFTLLHQNFNFAQPSLCVFLRLGDSRSSSPSVISSILILSPSTKAFTFWILHFSILLLHILFLRSSIIYSSSKQCCLPSEAQSVVTLKFYQLWHLNHQGAGLYWCFLFWNWLVFLFLCISVNFEFYHSLVNSGWQRFQLCVLLQVHFFQKAPTEDVVSAQWMVPQIRWDFWAFKKHWDVQSRKCCSGQKYSRELGYLPEVLLSGIAPPIPQQIQLLRILSSVFPSDRL